MALTKVHPRMITGGFHQVEDYGATGDGVTDDSAAVQRAADAAKADNGTVVFAAKTYRIRTGIDLRTASGVVVRGAGRNATTIETGENISVFTVNQFVDISDMSIMQSGTTGTGRAISTLNDQQAFHCTFQRMTFGNFKYGILLRYSLWCAFRDIRTADCTCGIRLARNDDMESQANPDAVAGWNLQGGWFHNQITCDNVLCQGGEVGIWASCMGATFNNVTCQRQSATGAGNSVLPFDQVGVGMWIEGGTDAGTGSGKGFQNVIANYYTESVTRSLKLKGLRKVDVIGWFSQGNSQSEPYQSVLEADNVEVHVSGSTGQSYWAQSVVLTGGANVYGEIKAIGGSPSVEVGCRYLPNNDKPQKYSRPFSYDNTGSGVSATIPVDISAKGVYRVSVTGLYNGITEIHCLYQVSRWSSPPTDNVHKIFGTETGYTMTLNTSSQITISQSGINRLQLSVFVEEVSAFSGDMPIALTAS